MATIPQYVSKEGLIKEGPQVQKNVNEEVRYGLGSNMQSIGKGVSDLGENLMDIQVKINKVAAANAASKAEVDRTKLLYEAEEKRKNMDPQSAIADVENVTPKITQQVADTYFKRAADKQEYLRQQEIQDAAYIIKQKADLNKKIVSESKVLLKRDLELDKARYRNASDEEQRLLVQKGIHDRIYNPDIAPIFSNEEERYKLEEDTIKEAQDDLKDAESLRRVKEKELRIAQETAVNARENEFIKMKVTGVDRLGSAISREDLIIMAKDDMKAGLISPKFADIYTNALKSPKAVGAKGISLYFADIISDINKGIKTPDKIKATMLQDLSDGYLSEKDFASASTYFDMLADKKPEDLVAQNVRKAWFGMGGNIYSEDKQKQAESRARMSRSFISKLQSGVNPQDAALEATREEVLLLQPNAVNYPNGMEVIDSHGKIKLVMPNGDLVDQPTKAKK